jgi:hypothetical protein
LYILYGAWFDVLRSGIRMLVILELQEDVVMAAAAAIVEVAAEIQAAAETLEAAAVAETLEAVAVETVEAEVVVEMQEAAVNLVSEWFARSSAFGLFGLSPYTHTIL